MAEESTDVQEVLEYLRSIEDVIDVILVPDPDNEGAHIPRLTVREGDARGTSYRQMVKNRLCAGVCRKRIPQGMRVLILDEGSPAEEAELHIALDPVEQRKRAVAQAEDMFREREIGVFLADTEAWAKSQLHKERNSGKTCPEPRPDADYALT